MKHSFFIFLLILYPILLSGQTWPLNNTVHYGLHGKVKSIYEVRYHLNTDLEDQQKNDQDKVATLVLFDTAGIIRQINVWIDGSLHSEIKYEYENDTITTPFRAVDYNADGSVFLLISYDFDPDKNTVTELYDRSWQKTYDVNRNPIHTEFYKLYQEMFVKILTKNDFTGKAIEHKFIREDGSIAFRYEYAYDFRGRLTSSRFYSQDGKLSWRSSYTYDRHNRLKQERIFKNNTLSKTTNYTYETDEHENWVLCKGVQKLVDNIYTQSMQEGTEIRQRVVTYH